jgi:GxxExxY protein
MNHGRPRKATEGHGITMLYGDVTEPILGAFYEVHHALGNGFLESVYERAMVVALEKRGLGVDRQSAVRVHFDGIVVGVFFADLVVDDRVIIELKACRELDRNHEAQLLNYLRATTLEVGLLLLFARKPSFRRLVLTNDLKPGLKLRGLPWPSVVSNDS